MVQTFAWASRVESGCLAVDASPVRDAVGYSCVSTCGYRRGWPGLGLRLWLVGVSVVRLRHLLRKGTSPQFERAAGNRFHRLGRDELQGGLDRRTYAVVDEANTGRHWQSSSPFTFVSQNLSRCRSGHDQPQRTTAGHFLAPLRLEPSLPSPAARSMLSMPTAIDRPCPGPIYEAARSRMH